VRLATFAGAAGGADLVVNPTSSEVSMAALSAAGADNLAGKVLLGISNALDFSRCFPPSCGCCAVRVPWPAAAGGRQRANYGCATTQEASFLEFRAPRAQLAAGCAYRLGQAARAGGPWLCRVRVPSGLVAVVVPSGCKTMPQPHRCTAIR